MLLLLPLLLLQLTAAQSNDHVRNYMRRGLQNEEEVTVPDCYSVEPLLASSTGSPDDNPCTYTTATCHYRALETREGLVTIDVQVTSCPGDEVNGVINNRCTMQVNSTQCECLYDHEDDMVTMLDCSDRFGESVVFPPGQNQTKPLFGTPNDNRNFFELASCDRPEPWVVERMCVGSPPPLDDIRHLPDMCYVKTPGMSCGGGDSDDCVWNYKEYILYNPPHGDDEGENYAAVQAWYYGCERLDYCQVNITVPHNNSLNRDEASVVTCNSCEVDLEKGEIVSVDCTNVPLAVNLSLSEDPAIGWYLEETEEMCNHSSVEFVQEFYEYCGHEDMDGRIEDVTEQCYAVDKARCYYRHEGFDDCTRYKRWFTYYNQNNSVYQERYGKIQVDVGFDCNNEDEPDVKNKCVVEVNNEACQVCENNGTTITKLNCSNVNWEGFVVEPDQTFDLLEGGYPKIVSTDEMCEHRAVQAQLECYNESWAASSQAIDPTFGQIVEGACYAVDKVYTHATYCGGCIVDTVEYQYYNQNGFDGERTDYAVIREVHDTNCYMGTTCTVSIGEYECALCLVNSDGNYTIDCTNVPDDAMGGFLITTDSGWQYLETPEMCEHPAVLNQTQNAAVVDERAGDAVEESGAKKESFLTVPSQLHFFFADSQDEAPDSEALEAVLAQVLDFLHSIFQSDPRFQPHLHSVRYDNVEADFQSSRANEWVISFDSHIALGSSQLTTGQAARLMAGANWDRYVNRDVNHRSTSTIPKVKRVVFRAVGHSQQ